MIYLAFDLHIGYAWTEQQLDRIWKFQSLVKPGDIVIYGGDTYECAWLTEDELKSKPEYGRFRNSHNSRTYELDGNHDMSCLPIHYEYWTDGTIIAMHGHQYDITCDSALKRFYYKLAPRCKNIWFNSPWKQKVDNDTKWQEHNLNIIGNAIKYVETCYTVNTLVIGHIHDSVKVTRRYSGKSVVAVGSLPEDGVYAVYDREVQIREV